jgi:hypothetical protein
VVAQQAAARRAKRGHPGEGLLLTRPEFVEMAKSNAQPVLVMAPNPLVESLWIDAKHVDPLWNESDFSVWEIPPATVSPIGSAPTHVVPPFQP